MPEEGEELNKLPNYMKIVKLIKCISNYDVKIKKPGTPKLS